MHQYFTVCRIQVAVDLLLLLYITFTTFIFAFIFFSPFNKHTRYSNIALFLTYSFANIPLKFSFKSLFKFKTMSSDSQISIRTSSSSDEILSYIDPSCWLKNLFNFRIPFATSVYELLGSHLL